MVSILEKGKEKTSLLLKFDLSEFALYLSPMKMFVFLNSSNFVWKYIEPSVTLLPPSGYLVVLKNVMPFVSDKLAVDLMDCCLNAAP